MELGDDVLGRVAFFFGIPLDARHGDLEQPSQCVGVKNVQESGPFPGGDRVLAEGLAETLEGCTYRLARLRRAPGLGVERERPEGCDLLAADVRLPQTIEQ